MAQKCTVRISDEVRLRPQAFMAPTMVTWFDRNHFFLIVSLDNNKATQQ
jgi:hypothetical protein